ncbi:hypothetical protein Pmani_026173 [Petrolisthes manimaculis]|uniref:Autocrine motility factor receptor n=1 Tax=Petrolisthes manimaculis TaxID=1843537 RepID=A0AAE1P6P6_9EUCA|nr:hypothetical protein Pmani_026173 [Petrolisthes manimaculis]
MPVVLDRLPLPNLTWYTGLSVLLLACSVYYAGVQVTLNPNWKERLLEKSNGLREEGHMEGGGGGGGDKVFLYHTTGNTEEGGEQGSDGYTEEGGEEGSDGNTEEGGEGNGEVSLYHTWNTEGGAAEGEDKLSLYHTTRNTEEGGEEGGDEVSLYHTYDHQQSTATGGQQERQMTPYLIPEVISFMFHEPLCIWTLINMAYCVLILLGTLIQRLVFGELRVSEQQHIKDKFWNFVFYKFIFVFGVMNVQAMDEVVLWCSWFSVLGFLHLLAQLCKDRFEYLSLSATTPWRTHVRLLGLLGIILTIATFCLLICVVVGCHSGFNTFAFMVAECILLIVRTLYVITRYCIYLWEITHEGLWERRGRYVYTTELVFELSELVIDMVHHIHMLVWGNMFLTMASLVICMQLRLLFYQLQHKIKSHCSYLRVLQLMNKYPEVSGDEVCVEERTCAICWELLGTGRCLPCSHVFHASCLLAWLHQDLSCPTCRHKLHKPEQSEAGSLLEGLLPGGEEDNLGQDNGVGDVGGGHSHAPPQGPGWRYVSWLPSFSVEQSHTQLPRHQQASAQPAPTSQLDNLARQVQQMFPDVSYSYILEDLQRTHSPEVTIDNILEQRLGDLPPMFTSQGGPSSMFDMSQSDHRDEIKDEDEDEDDHFQDASPAPQPRCSLSFGSDVSSCHYTTSSEDSSDTESDLSSKVSDGCCGSGGRFSKCPREREQILAQRRAALISQARHRYVSEDKSSSTMQESSD